MSERELILLEPLNPQFPKGELFDSSTYGFRMEACWELGRAERSERSGFRMEASS